MSDSWEVMWRQASCQIQMQSHSLQTLHSSSQVWPLPPHESLIFSCFGNCFKGRPGMLACSVAVGDHLQAAIGLWQTGLTQCMGLYGDQLLPITLSLVLFKAVC